MKRASHAVERTWMAALNSAFPMKVAPKKVENGIRKCPHVIPARSNSGLGICSGHDGSDENTHTYAHERKHAHPSPSYPRYAHPY